MIKKPFISVIIPTRNRPQLVKYTLNSLLNQSFTDFEVIVSDNHTGNPCKDVFDKYADHRFRYVTPPTPLLMHDNWEYACKFAQGMYVTVVMDKTILRPSALKIIHEASMNGAPEIISWWNESYYPDNEDISYDRGTYLPTHIRGSKPKYYDTKKELERRIECKSSVVSDAEGGCYYWGKICFGAYREGLIRRIHEEIGNMFHPVSPDYTSMVAALAFADSAIDIGQPLSITFSSKLSNGYNSTINPRHAFKFLHKIDPTDQIVNNLPIKGLYSSVHNLVAYDYMIMKNIMGRSMKYMQISYVNLLVFVSNDIRNIFWNDVELKNEQTNIVNNYLHNMPFYNRLLYFIKSTYVKNIGRLTLFGRKQQARTTCNSIHEAANYAERLYSDEEKSSE